MTGARAQDDDPGRVVREQKATIQRRAAVPAICLMLAGALAACGAGGGPGSGGSARRAAAGFLAAYVQPDGRVSRLDQGGDTVSEGQAYGLLLAEVAGDHKAFGSIWRWTRGHLQLGEGLFAYHADGTGKILSPEPASDADLLIAWALMRYRGPGAAALHDEGRRVAAAVLAREVTVGPGRMPVLAAGPWATGRPSSLNPSYWSLSAFDGLAAATGNPAWRRLAGAAVALASRLTEGGRRLPPDWASLTVAGVLRPEPAPGGSQPQTQYGLDAQRTVAWFAASCDRQARALAARWWQILQARGRAQAIALRLDGTVLNPAPSVLPLVASAAAARAAGDTTASQRLLQRAASQQHSDPTYYGSAWNALGTALLSSTAPRSCSA